MPILIAVVALVPLASGCGRDKAGKAPPVTTVVPVATTVEYGPDLTVAVSVAPDVTPLTMIDDPCDAPATAALSALGLDQPPQRSATTCTWRRGDVWLEAELSAAVGSWRDGVGRFQDEHPARDFIDGLGNAAIAGRDPDGTEWIAAFWTGRRLVLRCSCSAQQLATLVADR